MPDKVLPDSAGWWSWRHREGEPVDWLQVDWLPVHVYRSCNGLAVGMPAPDNLPIGGKNVEDIGGEWGAKLEPGPEGTMGQDPGAVPSEWEKWVASASASRRKWKARAKMANARLRHALAIVEAAEKWYARMFTPIEAPDISSEACHLFEAVSDHAAAAKGEAPKCPTGEKGEYVWHAFKTPIPEVCGLCGRIGYDLVSSPDYPMKRVCMECLHRRAKGEMPKPAAPTCADCGQVPNIILDDVWLCGKCLRARRIKDAPKCADCGNMAWMLGEPLTKALGADHPPLCTDCAKKRIRIARLKATVKVGDMVSVDGAKGILTAFSGWTISVDVHGGRKGELFDFRNITEVYRRLEV
jgi:hypothetical protein